MSNRIKEGNKAVNAVREKIQKKFFDKKISMSMVETDKDKELKAKANLKEGEEYTDRDGKVWYRTENGTLMSKSKVGFYGVPMFCPAKGCGKIMGGTEKRLNNKSYMRWGHCYGCQLEKERLLRMEGKLDDYLERKKKENIEAYAEDMESLLMTAIMEDKDVYKVISSSTGDKQVWRNMGIKKEEIEKFQKFVDKMKKKIGKDIPTKNDKKDE